MSQRAEPITAHFTDLREVLGPHLDLLLHQLLPVEGFVLQPLLCLLPPPPLLLQHLTASQALALLEERDRESERELSLNIFLICENTLGSTFIHLCTRFPRCELLLATGQLQRRD